MLNGIRIYTADNLWRKILTDLSAIVTNAPNVADVNLDSLKLPRQITPLELKATILNGIDIAQRKVIKRVFNKIVFLPRLQMQIVVLLVQTGGMSAAELKNVMGYLPDTATHTIDTAIYQLRKAYGHDFIKNENGKYSIGNL